ncbi:hypothetical protein IWX77_002429 [Cryobacterium sp. CAN_C2]
MNRAPFSHQRSPVNTKRSKTTANVNHISCCHSHRLSQRSKVWRRTVRQKATLSGAGRLSDRPRFPASVS